MCTRKRRAFVERARACVWVCVWAFLWPTFQITWRGPTATYPFYDVIFALVRNNENPAISVQCRVRVCMIIIAISRDKTLAHHTSHASAAVSRAGLRQQWLYETNCNDMQLGLSLSQPRRPWCYVTVVSIHSGSKQLIIYGGFLIGEADTLWHPVAYFVYPFIKSSYYKYVCLWVSTQVHTRP